ncbi:ComEC/Rec2 family competence protein [Paenibacillus ihbetae]|uniref:Competence protein ComEC n=1 Tax=Paenibacillus ihbetae TaxID=1870820 RepID=A0ABX3JUI6_9BACL|nr:ComEC/Rec2 family competence protein [Paenibacillus ihbetae]OOC60464.1 competence protein ComEC [Paenibacillus ihbetae]
MMRRRPLLAFTVLWVVGSSIACLTSGWRMAMAAAGILLLLLVVCQWERVGKIYTICMGLSLCCSAAYWEWHDAMNVSDMHVPALERGEADSVPMTGVGVISSEVAIDGDRADFKVSLRYAEIEGIRRPGAAQKDPAKLPGNSVETADTVMVQVRLLEQAEQNIAAGWQRGDSVHLSGELQQPGIARNFDGFDYRRYLRTQKIHWIVKVKGADQVKASAPEGWRASHILRWNDSLRTTLGDRLEQLFGSKQGGYMKGLVIGDRDDLDPDTFSEFSRLGLTHILAISGMHVAVIVGCLLFICSALRLTREASLTVVMCLLPAYVLLTGASPSIVRAGIMGMIGLYAARRGLLKDGLHILSTAALAMLIFNPYFLVDVSFQLSFIVTAGLMIFVPKVMPLLSFMPRWLAGTAGVTLVAQWVSFPLTIHYFNQFSLVSVAANLLLVPVISLIVLPLGMTSLLLSWVWMQGAGWIAGLTEWLNDMTFRLVGWMNGGALMTIWPSPSLPWMIVYFALLYGLLHILSKRAEAMRRLREQPSEDTIPLEGAGKEAVARDRLDHLDAAGIHPLLDRLSGALRQRGYWRISNYIVRFGGTAAAAAYAFALCLLLFGGYRPSSLHGAGLVQFLDVGQGDSILVTTPEGKHILIDGGGTLNFRKPSDAWKERKSPYEVGEKVVVPLLKKRGVHRLDAVIMSHGDQDHIGGLQAVLREIPVDSIVFNGSLTDSDAFRQSMAIALRKKIPVYRAGADLMEWKLGKDTGIRFLSPVTSPSGESGQALSLVKEQNHASLVFVLQMNGCRFLFTGDTDEAAEQKILLHMEERTDGGGLPLLNEPIDVMKVAHHGSKTSTSERWMDAWRPRAAVISAGVNNMYGHPHPDVVARLEQYRAVIYQTNRHGEIQMLVKDGAINVRSRLNP